jgi:hypothetical protein
LLIREQKTLEKNQQAYRFFIHLINRLRSANKISAEQWRSYRKQWEDFPQARLELFEKLSQRDSE